MPARSTLPVLLTALLLASGALTPACNATDPAVDEVPRTLRGRWFLEALEGVDVAALRAVGTRLPEILIDNEGAVSGFGGVNRFGTSLDLDVLGLEGFVLSQITTTMMAGEPAAMDLESRFLQALQDARAYRLTGATLELQDEWSKDEDERGEVVLVLNRGG